MGGGGGGGTGGGGGGRGTHTFKGHMYQPCIIHESECDMVKYFMSRLIYFNQRE